MSHTQSKLTQTPGLYIIHDIVRGRGVACVNMIEKDSTIEICPVILLSSEDTEAIHVTHLHDYYFAWDLELNTSAIALGYGSLYNHKSDANAEFEILRESNEIRIFALKDIQAGEEIYINYIAEESEEFPIWFEEK